MEHGSVVRLLDTLFCRAFDPASSSRRSNIPFLDITEHDISLSASTNIVAATAFSQAAVRAFTAEGGEEEKGGTLIMTGATSAWRGKEAFGAFAAGKHGLRALSQVCSTCLRYRRKALTCPLVQSIAREYGPHGVHVAFVVRSSIVVYCTGTRSY